MSANFRTVYIVRWEWGINDGWCIVGTYYSEKAALKRVQRFKEINSDGELYIETVILPAR